MLPQGDRPCPDPCHGDGGDSRGRVSADCSYQGPSSPVRAGPAAPPYAPLWGQCLWLFFVFNTHLFCYPAEQSKLGACVQCYTCRVEPSTHVQLYFIRHGSSHHYHQPKICSSNSTEGSGRCGFCSQFTFSFAEPTPCSAGWCSLSSQRWSSELLPWTYREPWIAVVGICQRVQRMYGDCILKKKIQCGKKKSILIILKGSIWNRTKALILVRLPTNFNQLPKQQQDFTGNKLFSSQKCYHFRFSAAPLMQVVQLKPGRNKAVS